MSDKDNIKKAKDLVFEALALLDDSVEERSTTSIPSNESVAIRSVNRSLTPSTRNESLPFRNPNSSSTSIGSLDRVEANFRNAFPALSGFSKRPSSKGKQPFIFKPRETWTHDFICLSTPKCTVTPSAASIQSLQDAGLGRKRVVFDDKNGKFQHVRDTLEKYYPPLESLDGAFELLRADRGGPNRNLGVVTIPQDGYSVPYIRNMCSTSLTYIRPMQQSLSLKTNSQSTMIGQICKKCGINIALNELRNHSLTCGLPKFSLSVDDDSDDSDLGENLKKKRRMDMETDSICIDDNDFQLPETSISKSIKSKLKCPICKMIVETEINAHLDSCLLNSSSVTSSSVTSSSATSSCAFSNPGRTNPAIHKDHNYSTSTITSKGFLPELKKLQSNFILSKQPKTFSIRYNNVLKDSIAKSKVLFKSGLVPIKVDFPGEVAVMADITDGGPLRELFSKIYAEVPAHLLNGKESRYTFQNDLHKLENNEYYVYGQLVALSFLMRGPGPRNFLLPFAEYLLDIEPTFTIDDIPDYDVQEKLRAISNESNPEKLQSLFDNFQERFEAGYNKLTIDPTDVKDLEEKITKYWIITRQNHQIEQFKKGLQSGGVLELFKRYPSDAMEHLIYDPSCVTADVISRLYKFRFSSENSVKLLEKDVAYQWRQFLDMVEAKEYRNEFNLQDLLQFLTGSRYLPPGGFSREGQITCKPCEDKNSGLRVTPSTCFLTLTIPLTNRYLKDDFGRNIIDDIRDSSGFGRL